MKEKAKRGVQGEKLPQDQGREGKNQPQKDSSSSTFAYGKLPKDFFDNVIFTNLGKKRGEVLVGPSHGFDNCVIKIGTDYVMVCTCDPLSFIPKLGPEDSAWLSVNLLASDLSTSGFRPQYVMLEFNLPPRMPLDEFEKYWKALSSECARLGISIVGGHTGKFEGCDYTIIGGGTMFSVGSIKACLTPSGASVGDKVILTKGAAIAATGILSRSFPNKVRDSLGNALYDKACAYFRKISVVDDALTAAEVGIRSQGVTAMHDSTEGGVLSSLYELAAASSLGIRVEKSSIQISEETSAVCNLFGIDALTSLSEGSLVLACAPPKANEIVESLAKKDIPASIVGELTKAEYGRRIVDQGVESTINYPITDPYWNAYYNAIRKGWN
jgi:hydrogenase expression/formation protein HypE